MGNNLFVFIDLYKKLRDTFDEAFKTSYEELKLKYKDDVLLSYNEGAQYIESIIEKNEVIMDPEYMLNEAAAIFIMALMTKLDNDFPEL
jgi:hypothetical protein